MREQRENIRVDELTYQLLLALITHNTDKKRVTKSEIYRKAIYNLAKQELPEDEFAAIVNYVSDSEKL